MTCPFASFSDAVAARVRTAAPFAAGLEWGTRHQISAVLWGGGIAVTSEQSLPEMDAYTALMPGGAKLLAVLVGRDSGTNIAALRLGGEQGAVTCALPLSTEPMEVGAAILALGSDGEGGPRARLGAIEALGPAWQSQCGGRIDSLIRLDISLGHTAEGGPVVDSRGGLIGMSTFGPRNQVLVIPAATIARVLSQLVEHGQVPRGWLGVGVQPVQIPREVETAADASSGLMVLSVAGGSPAAGRILPGDILIAAGDMKLSTPRMLTGLLGAEAIGSLLCLRVLRAGAMQQFDIEVTRRPA